MKPGRENAAGIHIGAGLSGYVAEMAGAFVCAALGIIPTVRHADYISSWLELCSPHHNCSYPQQPIM